MIKTYGEWVDIVDSLAYDAVLVDMLSDWQADGIRLTKCIYALESRIAELEAENKKINSWIDELMNAGNQPRHRNWQDNWDAIVYRIIKEQK